MKNILTNTHVIVALLIAPILAVISYLTIDHWLAEEPHAAKKGAQYPLVAKSNCRYASGLCKLENGEFSLTLRINLTETKPLLEVESIHPLTGIKVALAHTNHSASEIPKDLDAKDSAGYQWQTTLDQIDMAQQQLRLVASTGQSIYFGEAALVFAQPLHH